VRQLAQHGALGAFDARGERARGKHVNRVSLHRTRASGGLFVTAVCAD
jgi:hypothetical protein